MVFSSVIFLCFFMPVMIIGYYILPGKLRNLYLVLGSLFFYAWGGPEYVFIMIASITGNYIFGVLLDLTGGRLIGRKKIITGRILLVITILFNLGILFYFKYYTFALTTLHDLFMPGLAIKEITLPIGISFYTFQGMSYVIDVYRGCGIKEGTVRDDTLVQKNPLNLALYISMFPQLIAGPIVRYTDIKPYLKKRQVNLSGFSKGVERFIIGLAKKAILANTLGETADKIFTTDYSYMGVPVAWLGAILYTLQIYYDFSGYSDMAIGLGRIFGFEFMENFNYPYISKSVSEFWRRWHISLSSWFRDYLYIPLGGNRTGNVYFNLFIVFLATGIWHGAAFGFIVWGLWHGLFIITERVFRKKGVTLKLPAVVRWLYTMLIVVLGWVLFKLEELPATFEYIGAMFGMDHESYVEFSLRYYLDNKMIFILIIAIIAAIPWAQILPRHLASYISALSLQEEGKTAVIIKRISLIILMAISFMFIINSSYNPFIYFRF
ncbi:MAG: MBOAT family protein [Lachnospiraceae bacterium]|nr:MBOAT family protein [Lachnospiraceae bacterium]